MEQLACPERCVAGFGEAHLKCFDLWVSDEVVRGLIATGCRSVLTRKDRGATGRTEHTRRVGIRKVDPACGEPVNVRRDGVRRRFQTPDPVVHVINGKKQDVGFRVGCG